MPIVPLQEQRRDTIPRQIFPDCFSRLRLPDSRCAIWVLLARPERSDMPLASERCQSVDPRIDGFGRDSYYRLPLLAEVEQASIVREQREFTSIQSESRRRVCFSG